MTSDVNAYEDYPMLVNATLVLVGFSRSLASALFGGISPIPIGSSPAQDWTLLSCAFAQLNRVRAPICEGP